jgi:hypothetical protein
MMTRCLDRDALERLRRGDAPALRGRLWRLHLWWCRGCQMHLEELRLEDVLVRQVRRALGAGPPRPQGS